MESPVIVPWVSRTLASEWTSDAADNFVGLRDASKLDNLKNFTDDKSYLAWSHPDHPESSWPDRQISALSPNLSKWSEALRQEPPTNPRIDKPSAQDIAELVSMTWCDGGLKSDEDKDDIWRGLNEGKLIPVHVSNDFGPYNVNHPRIREEAARRHRVLKEKEVERAWAAMGQKSRFQRLNLLEGQTRIERDASATRSRVLRPRFGLPITIDTGPAQATVMSCPDSGSEDNAMSVDLAQTLGIPISRDDDSQKQFVLANGTLIKSVGRVEVPCTFSTGSTTTLERLSCVFYIFQKLASQMLMGEEFLNRTETLTKHRDRLVKRPPGMLRALRVRRLGVSRDKLFCVINNKMAEATPDTGAELDLASAFYAKKRGYTVQKFCEDIMFADGSVSQTIGFIRTHLQVRATSRHVDLHILPNLTSDIILGDQSLEDFAVYTTNRSALKRVRYNEDEPSQLQTIIRLGPGEEKLVEAAHSVGNTAKRVCRWMSRAFGGNSEPTSSNEGPDVSVWDRLNERDQRENERRDRVEQEIAMMVPSEREQAKGEEDARKRLYDEDKARVVQALNTRR